MFIAVKNIYFHVDCYIEQLLVNYIFSDMTPKDAALMTKNIIAHSIIIDEYDNG